MTTALCVVVFVVALVFLAVEGGRALTLTDEADPLDEHVASLPVEVVDWTAFERDVFPLWAWFDGPAGTRDRLR